MPKRNWPAVVAVCLLFAILFAGLLYFAGFNSTHLYPEMSSLNSGPRGTKLLFDALGKIHTVKVTRNYLPLSQWRPSSTTILFFAVYPTTLNTFDGYLRELEKLSQPDNRIVLFLADSHVESKANLTAKDRWGITVVNDKYGTALQHDSTWQQVSRKQDAWEKHFAQGGTVVVALGSEAFSNESLSGVADLIPPLIGQNNTVAFEETHLGIEESGSIAGLARRYSLQGLIGGLLLLVILFIWNRSVSFPPPPRFERTRDKQVVGADSRGMFAGLIARHLTPRALIESCIAEWNRVKPQQRITTETPAKLDAVAAYRQLQENLQSKHSRI